MTNSKNCFVWKPKGLAVMIQIVWRWCTWKKNFSCQEKSTGQLFPRLIFFLPSTTKNPVYKELKLRVCCAFDNVLPAVHGGGVVRDARWVCFLRFQQLTWFLKNKGLSPLCGWPRIASWLVRHPQSWQEKRGPLAAPGTEIPHICQFFPPKHFSNLNGNDWYLNLIFSRWRHIDLNLNHLQ